MCNRMFGNRINIRLSGHAVAQLVEALRYKPEGRGFDSRIFRSSNPSVSTVALGLTQPVTEMSTRIISCGGKGGR